MECPYDVTEEGVSGGVMPGNGILDEPMAGGGIQKSSEIRRSESLKVRRHGRIAVPMITVQGADDTKSEVKFVHMFTKSDSLDTGLEKQFVADKEFNIVVSPTKLVSLSKNNFIWSSRQGDSSAAGHGNRLSNINHKHSKVNALSGQATVSSNLNGEKNEQKGLSRDTEVEIKTSTPELRESSVPKVRKSSIQSTRPSRRLSPAPYHTPNTTERKQSLTSLMDSGKKRRDSVAAMPVATPIRLPSKHRRVSLAPTPSIPRRRTSIKNTLSSYVVPYGSIQARKPREHLAKNGLPLTLDNEDLKEAKIETDSIDVSIPVFHITRNDSRVSITDLTSIESAIHLHHPEVTVLKTDKKNGLPDCPPSLPVSDSADRMHEKLQGKSLSVIAEGEVGRSRIESPAQADTTSHERKVSIRTCVKRMREDTDDYTNQLIGCKNLGTYASMETLPVLLSKQEAIRCVVEAMNRFQDKEELQYNACASLLEMASTSEANCYIIHQNHGIPALLNCMKCYCERVPLMRVLLNIIGYLSSSEGLSHQLLQYGCHSRVLGAMSQHGDDNSIVKQCLFILGNLITTEETAQQIMLVGGVHTVIDMMNKFPDDSDILENGCRALGSFAAFDNTCLDVGQAGATKSVLVAMATSPDNVCVLECGCWALACLTTMADTCEELQEQDGVDILLISLERHPQEESLQEYGVRTICNLASLDKTLQTISTDQVLGILQRVTSQFPDSVELQGQVVFALSQMARSGEEMQKRFMEMGAVRSVVGTMKLHPEDIPIQEHGCRILGNMAVNGEIRRQTEEEGASSAVIGAMLTLDTCAEIQEYGCMALMNLTADIKDNKIRVKNNGGVLGLLTCLTNFRSRPNIVLSALKTLGNIIELDEVCRLVMDERGLRTIVEIVRDNRDYPDVNVFAALVLCGLSGLKNLSTEDIEMIDRTMTGMLSQSSLDADLTLFVCMALENILNTDAGMHVFIAEKRLDVILATMKRFSSHPEILQCCCKMIAVLALDSRHEMTTEAVQNVLVTMTTYSAYKDVQIVGCGALSCLSENNPSLMTYAVDEGGVGVISDALSQHPEEHRLHAVALMALANLSTTDSPSHADRVLEIQGLIHLAMTRFPENLEIQICACNAVTQCRPTEGKRGNEFLEALRHSLRRHGKTDALHRPMARALRSFWQAGHKDAITKMLEICPAFQHVFTAELKEAEVNDE